MKKNKYSLHLFGNIFFTKGFHRSVISDLQFNRIYIVPNSLYYFLYNNQLESDSVKDFKTINFEYNTWIEYLIENRLAHITNLSDHFPKINLDFVTPSIITNITVEINDLTISYLASNFFLKTINKFCVKAIFIDSVNGNLFHLNKLLVLISSSSIDHIEIYFKCINDKAIDVVDELIEKGKIKTFTYYNTSNSNDNIIHDSIIVSNSDIDKVSINCGVVLLNNAYSNIKLFSESQNYNTCLNRKISIDKDGNIKNCPSMPQSFGNIKDTTLEEAINHPDFKKYWNVNKDMIAVCKDCEFRHICTDCRAYTERTHFEDDIDLSKPLKCGYNPYTNEWAEWSTNPLKEKAIEYYGMQDLVKKDA
jgi:SPASM domain peptide maturase of grasp-with-spasm system